MAPSVTLAVRVRRPRLIRGGVPFPTLTAPGPDAGHGQRHATPASARPAEAYRHPSSDLPLLGVLARVSLAVAQREHAATEARVGSGVVQAPAASACLAVTDRGRRARGLAGRGPIPRPAVRIESESRTLETQT